MKQFILALGILIWAGISTVKANIIDSLGFRYYRFAVETLDNSCGNCAGGVTLTEAHFVLNGSAYPEALGTYNLVPPTDFNIFNDTNVFVLFDGDTTVGPSDGRYIKVDQSLVPFNWTIDMEQRYQFDSFFFTNWQPYYYKVPGSVEIFGTNDTSSWYLLGSGLFTNPGGLTSSHTIILTYPTPTVPEPGSLALLGLGIASLGFIRRKYRK